MSSKTSKIDTLPFYFRPLEAPFEQSLPIVLPFRLKRDPSTGVYLQELSPIVSEALTSAYAEGSYFEGLMDAKGIGAKYAEDFLAFIDEEVGLSKLRGKKVLEIGCGTGYLLHELKQYGADVLGYEPGYQTIGKHDVPVITKMFPSNEVKSKQFDLILGFALIEHVFEPQAFLNEVKSYLKVDGQLLIAVPDCETHIRNGDISMCVHEHISYFTLESLKCFVESCAYQTQGLRRSGFGGSLYGSFKAGKQTSTKQGYVVQDSFHERFTDNLKNLQEFLQKGQGETVGIYVPLRAMNFLHVLKGTLKQNPVRLFDDAQFLRGKYLPGLDVPIENEADLKKSPCDVIIVFSYSFGSQIKKRLEQNLPSETKVLTISELFGRGEKR